jgi:hypothetical protein
LEPQLLLQCYTLSSMLSVGSAAHGCTGAKWARPAFSAGPCSVRSLLHSPIAVPPSTALGAGGARAVRLNARRNAGAAGGCSALSFTPSPRQAPLGLHVGPALGWPQGGVDGGRSAGTGRRLASAGAGSGRARVGTVSGVCLWLCVCARAPARIHTVKSTTLTHTNTHARAHAHTHAHTHKHAHKHTHKQLHRSRRRVTATTLARPEQMGRRHRERRRGRTRHSRIRSTRLSR